MPNTMVFKNQITIDLEACDLNKPVLIRFNNGSLVVCFIDNLQIDAGNITFVRTSLWFEYEESYGFSDADLYDDLIRFGTTGTKRISCTSMKSARNLVI